jgi:hypothetical protein
VRLPLDTLQRSSRPEWQGLGRGPGPATSASAAKWLRDMEVRGQAEGWRTPSLGMTIANRYKDSIRCQSRKPGAADLALETWRRSQPERNRRSRSR